MRLAYGLERMMNKQRVHLRYKHPGGSSGVLDQVERWCSKWGLLLREKGLLWEFGREVKIGRIDGLIVPTSWKAPNYGTKEPFGLIGVEVKVTRSDFLRGLKSGQYEFYAEKLSGLYVAGPVGVVSKKEVPEHVGVLFVGRRGISCARRPKWKRSELSNYQMWRILWAMREHLEHRLMEIERVEYEIEQMFRKHVIAPAVREVKRRLG